MEGTGHEASIRIGGTGPKVAQPLVVATHDAPIRPTGCCQPVMTSCVLQSQINILIFQHRKGKQFSCIIQSRIVDGFGEEAFQVGFDREARAHRIE